MAEFPVTKYPQPLPSPGVPGKSVGRIARPLIPGPLREVIRRRMVPKEPRRAWEKGFDFRPPPTPPGMRTGPPDFVGAGAQRSGTSWWFTLMNRHPLVHSASGHKELHFLMRFLTAEPSDDDVSDYASWFPRPTGAIAGEWTPYYLAHFWFGSVLNRMAPEAKVLVILRDPVERYCSGIALARTGRSLGHAIEAWHGLQGFYGGHLRQLERQIPPDRIFVLQYERCVVDRQAQLDRTFRFLGLDPVKVADVDHRVGRALEPYRISPQRRAQLVEAYRPDVEDLATRYPEIDVSLWKNF